MSKEDELLERAWDTLERGEIEDARAQAEKMLATEDVDPADAFLLLAACAREENQPDRALGFLEQATRNDPDWSTPHLWMAELLSARPGSLEDALRHAGHALDKSDEETELLEALALKSGLELDLGKLKAARDTLSQFPATDTTVLDPPLALEVAHLFLAAGDPARAQERFEHLVAERRDLADGWHGLGLAAEMQGDEVLKKKAWLETLALDLKEPNGNALSESDIAEEAEEALSELPARARALLANIPILIRDLPAQADVAAGVDPRLLGLFQGAALPDVSTVGGAVQLTQILLFRRNLERISADADELRAEIRTTLLHETGHFFGMTEDDLAKVGLD